MWTFFGVGFFLHSFWWVFWDWKYSTKFNRYSIVQPLLMNHTAITATSPEIQKTVNWSSIVWITQKSKNALITQYMMPTSETAHILFKHLDVNELFLLHLAWIWKSALPTQNLITPVTRATVTNFSVVLASNFLNVMKVLTTILIWNYAIFLITLIAKYTI